MVLAPLSSGRLGNISRKYSCQVGDIKICWTTQGREATILGITELPPIYHVFGVVAQVLEVYRYADNGVDGHAAEPEGVGHVADYDLGWK